MDQKFSIGLNSRQNSFAQKFAINKGAIPVTDFFLNYFQIILLFQIS